MNSRRRSAQGQAGTSGTVAANRGGRLVAFASGVFLVATGAAAATVATSDWQPRPLDVVAGLALVSALVLARKVAILVGIRKNALQINVVEIPLMVGLLTVEVPVVLFAYVAVMLSAGLSRRNRPAQLAINAGSASLQVTLTYLLAVALMTQLPGGAPFWSAILVGFAVAQATTALLGLNAIWLMGAGNPTVAARLMAHMYVVGLLSAVVGIIGVQLVTGIDWGWLLLGLLSLSLVAVYQAYYGLLREQRDLGLLNQVSLVVAGAGRDADGRDETTGDGQVTDVWLPAAELIREQLNATRVVLHREAFPSQGVRTVVAGEPLPPSAPKDDLSILYGDVLSGAPDGGVQHANIVDAELDVQHQLELRGARETLVVPLRGAHQILGVLEVHDLQSRLRGFS
ncbi:MAG TPA: diguanylate phosphodiesterase, partial [Pseudonocardiaceae bacterium]|nr:diguanylate phosphodiesterase [Pseudonocardiaceae bacterium]